MLNVPPWQTVLGFPPDVGAVCFHSATRALVKSQWCIPLHNTWAKQILLTFFCPAVPSSHFSAYTSSIPFLAKEETRGERSRGNSLFSYEHKHKVTVFLGAASTEYDVWHSHMWLRSWLQISCDAERCFMMDWSSWILIIIKLCLLSHIFCSWPNSS